MIYFIGAGPGAKDLITVRGMRLLQQAKLVIYAGSLVNPELLEYCAPDCRVLNSASMTLEQVVAAFRQAWCQRQTVATLHDAFHDGRELQELTANAPEKLVKRLRLTDIRMVDDGHRVPLYPMLT